MPLPSHGREQVWASDFTAEDGSGSRGGAGCSDADGIGIGTPCLPTYEYTHLVVFGRVPSRPAAPSGCRRGEARHTRRRGAPQGSAALVAHTRRVGLVHCSASREQLSMFCKTRGWRECVK